MRSTPRRVSPPCDGTISTSNPPLYGALLGRTRRSSGWTPTTSTRSARRRRRASSRRAPSLSPHPRSDGRPAVRRPQRTDDGHRRRATSSRRSSRRGLHRAGAARDPRDPHGVAGGADASRSPRIPSLSGESAVVLPITLRTNVLPPSRAPSDAHLAGVGVDPRDVDALAGRRDRRSVDPALLLRERDGRCPTRSRGSRGRTATRGFGRVVVVVALLRHPRRVRRAARHGERRAIGVPARLAHADGRRPRRAPVASSSARRRPCTVRDRSRTRPARSRSPRARSRSPSAVRANDEPPLHAHVSTVRCGPHAGAAVAGAARNVDPETANASTDPTPLNDVPRA